MKYKNKDGIQLSYEGHRGDSHTRLIKEVIAEAIKLGDKEIYSKYPRQGWSKVRRFLQDNFAISKKNG